MVAFVAAVTDKNALLMDNPLRAQFLVIIGKDGIVFQSLFKRDRQASGKIHVSKKNFGNRPASLLSWVPRFGKSRNALEPASGAHISAGSNNHDGIFVLAREFPDQFVLPNWQSKGAVSTLRLTVILLSTYKR